MKANFLYKTQYEKSELNLHLPYTERLQKTVAVNGAWISSNEYQVRIYFYQMPDRMTYTFKFEGDKLEWDSKLEHSLFGAQKRPQLTGHQ